MQPIGNMDSFRQGCVLSSIGGMMAEPTIEAAITLRDIFVLAGSTGLATAIFNGLFGWAKDWFDRRRVSKEIGGPFALGLIGSLHAYAQTCATEAGNIDAAAEEGHYLLTVPPPLSIPHDGEWSHIPIKIAGRIRDLEADTRSPDPDIHEAASLHGAEDGASVAHFRLCLRGYEAFHLASELRWHFGMEPYHTKAGHNFPQFLAEGSKSARRGPLQKLWRSYKLRKVRRRFERAKRHVTQIWQRITSRIHDD